MSQDWSSISENIAQGLFFTTAIIVLGIVAISCNKIDSDYRLEKMKLESEK